MARVLDDEGERVARAVGAMPQRAIFTTDELEGARDALLREVRENRPAGLSGVSFSIDPASGKLTAEYVFDGVDPVVLPGVRRFGDMVVASATSGMMTTHENVRVAGANMVRSDGGHCVAAFAVDIENPGGAPGNGVMTAGHCFEDGDPPNTKFDIDTTAAGNTQATGEFFSFGVAGDYGFLRLERDRGEPFMVNSRPVQAIVEPVVGTVVCKEGGSTGHQCGEIDRVNVATFLDHNGRSVELKGMVQAAYCGEDGDSGAPIYTDFDEGSALGVAALGVHSSGRTFGNGICRGRMGDRSISWFTPLSGIDTQNKYHIRISGG
jgi:hypothetical protein